MVDEELQRPRFGEAGPDRAVSDRELDVFRLLGSELSGPDIARELMISIKTLRTHTKCIYMKLEVNNRRTAVRRAQELNLLSRRHST
jgi:LuxR family maltose regulon positive regulatory protein